RTGRFLCPKVKARKPSSFVCPVLCTEPSPADRRDEPGFVQPSDSMRSHENRRTPLERRGGPCSRGRREWPRRGGAVHAWNQNLKSSYVFCFVSNSTAPLPLQQSCRFHCTSQPPRPFLGKLQLEKTLHLPG